MAKALILLGVAIGAGLLVYLLAAPRFGNGGRRSPDPPTNIMGATDGQSNAEGSSGPSDGRGQRDTSSGPIAPPQTAQEKEREDIESRRAPLYGKLHQDLGPALKAVRPSDEDAATLDLYAAQDAPGNTITLLNMALKTNIGYYGFRHIRFYTPNPPGAIELYKLDAEASADSAGNWQTFKK